MGVQSLLNEEAGQSASQPAWGWMGGWTWRPRKWNMRMGEEALLPPFHPSLTPFSVVSLFVFL